MDGRACLAVGLSLCGLLLSSGVQEANKRAAKRDAEIPGLSMTLGALTITSDKVILRCEMRNDSEDDVWIYVQGPEVRRVPPTREGLVFVGTDGRPPVQEGLVTATVVGFECQDSHARATVVR